MEDNRTQSAEAAVANKAARPTRSERFWSIKWLRLTVIGLATLIVVVAVLEWIEWPFLRGPLESALGKALKREVSVGHDFGVRFIGPLRFHTDRLVIGAAPQGPNLTDGQAADLIRAENLRLALPYSTVFALARGKSDQSDPPDNADNKTAAKKEPKKRPYIDRLEVSRLDATLLRDAEGHANWQFSTEKKDTEPLVLPEFGRLEVKAGEIRVDDALARLKLLAEVRTLETASSGTTAAGPGGLEITARGTYRDQPLNGSLRASGLLPLAESTASTPPVPVKLEARAGNSSLDFDGTASDVLKLGGLDGEFRLAGPSLAAVGDIFGVTLPTTSAFSMRGKARKEGAVWSTEVAELSVGTSRLRGEFRYDPTLAVPKLTGKLGGARLSLPDLGPAFGAPPRPRTAAGAAGAAKSTRAQGSKPARIAKDEMPRADAPDTKAGATDAKAGATPARRVLPQREFDLPSLAAMDADVAINLAEADLGTGVLEQFAPLQAHLVLDNQVLTLNDVVARTARGEVRGVLAVDAREKTPRWSADLRLSGVQLERFIKPRDRADRSANRGYVSGSLSGRAQVRGSGRSTAQVLSSLEGQAQLWVRNGAISHLIVEVAGLDVAQALGMLVRGDEQLPMRCAVAGLKISRGEISPEVAVIETSDSTLTIEGGISLAKERLALVFKTQPKDRSPVTLRSPVYVEGTFANPEVRLDKASLGMRIAAAAALAAVTPLAGLLALIDLGEPEKQVCAEALQALGRTPDGKPAAPPRR